MNRMNTLWIALAAALMLPLTALAQVRNEGLANGIVAARQKNATMLAQYNWNCRTEVLKGEAMQDLRIDLVNLGPDGQPQRTLLNDQQGRLPGGFFRKAIAEGQRKKLEKFAEGLGKLVDQYTLPAGGKVVEFLSQAQVQPITSPDGRSLLQVNGSGVVVPGDTFSMTLDGASLLPTSVQISTTFEGDQVTISATFKTMNSGLHHLQYATVEVPSKSLTVNIHNYDYVPND
ncbi:MAG: hypothetical protein KF745_10615 [Phycisphaeraceae bacterium]|nr:hypothetical protein [Phycisphaeraceae bacterium]